MGKIVHVIVINGIDNNYNSNIITSIHNRLCCYLHITTHEKLKNMYIAKV